jgi:hypothetical protein
MAAAGILKLQRAGFSDDQVEALAEYFDEQMATKADLGAAEARLEAAIEQVRGEIATVEARLETKIEQARSDTIKWVVGVAFAQVAMIFAILRLLPGGHP